jgi:hypothetical protein
MRTPASRDKSYRGRGSDSRELERVGALDVFGVVPAGDHLQVGLALVRELEVLEKACDAGIARACSKVR